MDYTSNKTSHHLNSILKVRVILSNNLNPKKSRLEKMIIVDQIYFTE